MNDVQNEIERLKRQVEQLQKALGERQQLAAPNLPALRDNYEFVLDMTRYTEQLEGYSEKNLRRKWNFTEESWEQLGKDDRLVEKIDALRMERTRSGATKREKAQQLIIKGPEILDNIATSPKASDKHKIDALKALNDLSDPGPQRNTADEDRVHIVINLGADEKLVFNKPLRPTPDDKIIDNTPALPGFIIPEG